LFVRGIRDKYAAAARRRQHGMMMMMRGPDLHWLPTQPAWSKALANIAQGPEAWPNLCALARARLDAIETRTLDRTCRKVFTTPPGGLAAPPIRLAVLASSTVDHLLPAIRVGGLRRDLWIDIHTPEYGQYKQSLMDAGSDLHAFQPTAVLFALDSHHLVGGFEPGGDAADVAGRITRIAEDLAALWTLARQAFQCQVIQQTALPVFPLLFGSNEHRLPGSRHGAVRQLNTTLRELADQAGVDLLSLDVNVAADGLSGWHDPALWHRAKQEIHPLAAPVHGDLVARLLAAGRGRSSKALVLDLDNTLWGGVIGDDGMEGIKLGQGSALGEAFTDFQRYVRDLSRRGIILAVCSKNDEANAIEPFERHPEMVLQRSDIACFVANWDDKATNIRRIAEALNIGLDSLVFADDNPAERAIVRRELPMVAVPELPDDPTLWPATLAAAGYFESLRLTQEDLDRAGQYQANLQRESLMAAATDMAGYLRSLDMRAVWNRFDRVGQARIVQLINKTNQFNLTTRRVTDEQIAALIEDENALTLQIRLLDTFGDNGIIAIVVGIFEPGTFGIRIETWLMSCRVLGRQMEEETLNLIVEQARVLGARRLIGEYRPTAKNAMVRDHYRKLGFRALDPEAADGVTRWELTLADWTPVRTAIISERVSA
jgi:FkbH-like protein